MTCHILVWSCLPEHFLMWFLASKRTGLMMPSTTYMKSCFKCSYHYLSLPLLCSATGRHGAISWGLLGACWVQYYLILSLQLPHTLGAIVHFPYGEVKSHWCHFSKLCSWEVPHSECNHKAGGLQGLLLLSSRFNFSVKSFVMGSFAEPKQPGNSELIHWSGW